MRLANILKNPRNAAILGIILGLALGLLVGWVVWPIEYTNAVPQILSQQYQEEYLRMAMDSYHLNKDPDLALQRWTNLGSKAPDLLFAIIQNPGTQKPAWILDYKSLIESRIGAILSSSSTPETTNPAPPPTTTKLVFVVLGSLLALGVIVGAVYYFLLKPILYGKHPATGEISAARQAQDITNTVEKTDYAELGLEKPITQTMTTYVLGDDLYDESFSIDSQSGEFLGEYGVGVSEMMGVGEPKKVTAIEIWLFDKNDIKTATKVLMSQHAFNDQNIRSRLEAKGELVLIQPQAQVVLETATLQLLATIVDLEYGHGSMPEKSYFERITLELAIWPR
jgi:hypothetical protein